MYRLISCTLLVVFHVSITAGNSPKYTHYDPYIHIELQCDQCPPGTFVRHDCTAEKRTECAPCPSKYFTSEWNSFKDCQYCSTVCKELQVTTQECSSTGNRICECVDGYFLDVEFCSPHTACPSGYGVVQQGTPDRDTICSECPKGTFSNTTSSTAPCQTRTNCRKLGRNVLHKGSSTHDTVCKEEPAFSCEIDLKECEKGVFNLLGSLNLTTKNIMTLMRSLPGKRVKQEDIEKTLKTCEQPKHLLKLFSLWRNKNNGNTIEGLKELKMGQLPRILRKRMKKLGQFLSGDSMYSLYQKMILEINGNQTQAVKLETLL
ncbi:tumor necrosis factor receptor superfamily member 11B isoform 2-T2 [Anomaloglossus baeobatrachus]|uniref:tumor necrosis factor receptor superfamily member 11B isoform X2 n=1 Tax=Anomaloglossus baeobatrachus TaxID=238106 RepID=UPI003F4FCE7A